MADRAQVHAPRRGQHQHVHLHGVVETRGLIRLDTFFVFNRELRSVKETYPTYREKLNSFLFKIVT